MTNNNTETPKHTTTVEVSNSVSASPAVESLVKNVDTNIESILPSGGNKAVKTQKKAVTLTKTNTVSAMIAQLLGSGRKKKQNLSEAEKTKLVLKKLQKNEQSILKQISKNTAKRHFSAHNLEKLAQELRYVRSLIEQILHKTIKNIETLYRKFVLNISDSEGCEGKCFST
ncbi:hypothetical protein CSB37_02805 [bacterium DOLZORAL124_38_8]|nr:MAG: hypothetical protein CSB37_02805 [bacterium DOLZORAL124_38_8]